MEVSHYCYQHQLGCHHYYSFKQAYRSCVHIHSVSKKCATFIFMITLANMDQFHIFSEKICGISWY